MKRKIIVFAIFILAAVLLGYCFIGRSESLGNMTRQFREPTTGASSISFAGDANEKIKLSFVSNVDAGELDIVLYDSDRNVVYELDRAKALETYYAFDKEDTYTLMAEYVDFVGDYKIVVYKME